MSNGPFRTFAELAQLEEEHTPSVPCRLCGAPARPAKVPLCGVCGRRHVSGILIESLIGGFWDWLGR